MREEGNNMSQLFQQKYPGRQRGGERRGERGGERGWRYKGKQCGYESVFQ